MRAWAGFAVYPLLAACVAVLCVAGGVGLLRLWGPHGVLLGGDVELGLSTLLLGTPGFALATRGAAALEDLRVPEALDHLRHGALLYLWALGWLPWVVGSAPRQMGGLGWGLVAASVALALYGLAVNAATLAWMRRRGRVDFATVP